MGKFTTDLALIERKGRYWELSEPLEYNYQEGKKIVVPKGYLTDLASVPRIFWPVLPSKGSYTRAAVVHDLLWQINIKYYHAHLPTHRGCLEVKGRKYPIKYSFDPAKVDDIFLDAMKDCGTNLLVRNSMWFGVRMAAIFMGRKGSMSFKHWVKIVCFLVCLFISIVFFLELLYIVF